MSRNIVNIAGGLCEEFLTLTFPTLKTGKISTPEIPQSNNYINMDEYVIKVIRKNFDPSYKSLERLLRIIERMNVLKTPQKIVSVSYCDHIFSLKIGFVKYLVAIKRLLERVREITKFNSGLAWFSEKLREHCDMREKEIKEIYRKAWEKNPLLFVYVLLLHRITHHNTSGKKGGRISERRAKELFKEFYSYFMDMLGYLKMEHKNLPEPENFEKAFEIFCEKEPENIFKDHLSIS